MSTECEDLTFSDDESDDEPVENSTGYAAYRASVNRPRLFDATFWQEFPIQATLHTAKDIARTDMKQFVRKTKTAKQRKLAVKRAAVRLLKGLNLRKSMNVLAGKRKKRRDNNKRLKIVPGDWKSQARGAKAGVQYGVEKVITSIDAEVCDDID